MTKDEALKAIQDDVNVKSNTRTTRFPQTEKDKFVGCTWLGRAETPINGSNVKVVILHNDDGRLHMAGLDALLDAIDPTQLDGGKRTETAAGMRAQHCWLRYDLDTSNTNPRKVWEYLNDADYEAEFPAEAAPAPTTTRGRRRS